MSQSNYNIPNDSAPAVRAQLNSVFGSIATNNSGATEPDTTFPFQWWYDTSEDTLKIRNAADSGWIEVGEFDQAGGTFTVTTEDGPILALINSRVPEILDQVIVVEERTATNVARGLETAVGAWAKLRLNTQVKNGIPGATVNTTTFVITLPAGSYQIQASAVGGDSVVWNTLLRDVTNSVDLALGITSRNGGGEYHVNNMVGFFTLAGSANIELRQTANSRSTPTWNLGIDNVFSHLLIRKIS